MHTRMHTFDCNLHWPRGRAKNGFWSTEGWTHGSRLRKQLGLQSIHAYIFRNKRTGASERQEQELSDRERHIETWSCQVRSGSKNRSPVRRTALLFGSLLLLSPAGSRLAGAPRFPMPSFHVRVRAHKAAVLIDGLERGLELLYRCTLLNKAEVLVER